MKTIDGYLIVAFVVLGFGIGFASNELINSPFINDANHYREHKREVQVWMDFLERARPDLPSVTKRGIAEQSADVFWPVPDEKSSIYPHRAVPGNTQKR